MSDTPVNVDCPKCGAHFPVTDAEVGGTVPVRCRKCAYIWRPFKDEVDNDLPRGACAGPP
jgi:predicted Zn finger-like uncharacterized protein